MDQDRNFIEIKPALPNPVTTDQAFLKLIVERLDLMNALLLDVCTYTQRMVEALANAKTVNVTFDVEKLAERLNLQRELAAKPSAFEDLTTSANTSRLKRASKTSE